jgi:prepilin-type processing-associated H-X9-DG protein
MNYKGALFVSGFLAFSAMAGEINVAAKQQNAAYFKAVTSKLDPGGTSYLYFTPENAYKMMRKMFDGSRGLFLKNVPDKAQQKEINAVFSLIEKVTVNSGLTEIKGCGFSAIAINEDLYRGRGVIYAPTRKGIIWQVAGKNRNFSFLKKLPANTAMAYYSQIHLDVLWAWLKKELANSAIEDKNSLIEYENDLLAKGIDLNKLLKSTTGEVGMVLTVDMDQKQEVNLKGQAVKISRFQLALFLGVKDDTIFKLIQSRMPPMVSSDGKPAPKDRIIYSLPFLPAFIKPIIANKGGYLFLASHPQLVDTLAEGAQKRLVDTNNFKKLAIGIPAERGLSFSYVNADLTNFIIEVQDAFSQDDKFQKILADIQRFNKPAELFETERMYNQGLLSVFNCNIDPTANVLVKAAVIPVAIVAGALAPALSKARGRAKSVQTSSNLKQLGLALKMYAMDHKDKFPAQSGMTGLDILVKQSYINPKVLQDKSGSKYLYIGGLSEEMSFNLPLIIALPKPGGPRNIVLFLDGHVESFRAAGMTDCVEVIKFLNNKYKYKAKEYQHLLEQARKLDSGMVK